MINMPRVSFSFNDIIRNMNCRGGRKMEKVDSILYRFHKKSYYFTVGAFTSYGATALLFGISICLIFVTGAYVESPMLMIMGLMGPFIEAKAIVAVYEEGRKIVKYRRRRNRRVLISNRYLVNCNQ